LKTNRQTELTQWKRRLSIFADENFCLRYIQRNNKRTNGRRQQTMQLYTHRWPDYFRDLYKWWKTR